MSQVPNIVGFIRFTYGFHRTGSDEGIILDVWLGVECAANLCSDVAIILLLWKPTQMARVLKAFVMWNAASLLWCCGGNLIGLRYPPKWWTHVSADELTRAQKLKHIAVWAPVIILAALTKLYYTNILYDFYLKYNTSGGKAFGESSVVAPPSVHIEGRRMSENRAPDDATAQSLFKSADATIKTRSHALGLKSRRQPVDLGEDCTTTILLAGTMTGKSSGRLRKQSRATAEDGISTTAGTKFGKTGARLRRQSRGPAEDCTTTIIPAKCSKMGGRARKQSVAGGGRANVTAKGAKPPAAMPKGQPVTTTAASTIRKPATQGSRRQSICGARGKQTDRKNLCGSLSPPPLQLLPVPVPVRDGNPWLLGPVLPFILAALVPRHRFRRRGGSLSQAPPASEVAQLVAARKARRRSLKSEDAAGIAAFAASKKPAGQSCRHSIATVGEPGTPPLSPDGEDRL
ncbi:hypothetical protein MTO96_046124 [Rhipicephalus appendiculatus]